MLLIILFFPWIGCHFLALGLKKGISFRFRGTPLSKIRGSTPPRAKSIYFFSNNLNNHQAKRSDNCDSHRVSGKFSRFCAAFHVIGTIDLPSGRIFSLSIVWMITSALPVQSKHPRFSMGTITWSYASYFICPLSIAHWVEQGSTVKFLSHDKPLSSYSVQVKHVVLFTPVKKMN